jgi:hypothetical protein
MSRLAQHIAGGLDPVRLAARIGMDPDPWQTDVLRSATERDLLVVHRQGGKSATAAVCAVHCALYEPGALILVVSPSQRQSQELFRSILVLYRALGRPVPSEAENALSVTLENGSRIIALPADATTIRGYSKVRLLIVDEAAFVSDATMAAVRPMLAVSSGRILAMSTPFGRRGWFYEASNSKDWRVTTVRADQCPRISAEFLAGERRAMGEWRYKQEFECQFVDIAGLMFSADDIRAIFEPGELGLIPPGALFSTTKAPGPGGHIRSTPTHRPQATRPSRCKRSHEGHFWHAGACIHCGDPK